MKQLLTATELARVLKVRPETVYRLRKSGRIPCYRLGQRRVRFDLEETPDQLGPPGPPRGEDQDSGAHKARPQSPEKTESAGGAP